MNMLKGRKRMSYCHSKYFFNCSLSLLSAIAMCQLVFMTSILPTLSLENNSYKYFDLFSQVDMNSGTVNTSMLSLGYEQSKLINNLIKNIDYLKRLIALKVPLKISSVNEKKIRINSTTETMSQIKKNLNLYQHELVRIFKVLDKNDFIHKDNVDSEFLAWKRQQGEVRLKRSATAFTEKHWDHGVIPYIIEPRFNSRQKDLFVMAMEMWEKSTCLVFKEKDVEDKNYLIFTVRSCGCCSFVGKMGDGGQAISIGKNCDKLGTVLHELGHTIGFWHEHTRPDRDKFVEILLDNVLAEKKSNFDALNSSEVNSLGESYDFESIMHYARNTFANITYLDTILTRRLPGTPVRPGIGHKIKLSPGDIRQANKLYKCPSCGSTMQMPTGNLGYSAKLGQSDLCQWRIAASYGVRVRLKVTSLDITFSDNCEKNYLEIRDGHYFKSPSLGRFCGNEVPGIIISSGRRLWVEFKSNGGLDEFSAEYVTLCGGSLMKDEDVIASPGYPHSYQRDNHCVWRISAKYGFVVVRFESLDLEFDDNCTKDYLEIRDGHGDSAAIIGRYCGDVHPKEVRSSGNNMTLIFKSDSEIEKAGFSVSYVKEMDECVTESHGCDQVCINTIGSYKCECRLGYELHSNGKTCKRECGGNVYESKGNITSPSFPDNYPPDKLCIWNIIAPKGHTISLNFTYFELEGNSEKCYFDYVVVNRESGKYPRKNEFYCGSVLPKPIISSGNELKIEFKSDGYDEKIGFSALFATDQNECEIKNGGCGQICKNTVGSYLCACKSGYILQSDQRTCLEGCQKEISVPKGNITSPDYPVSYPRNLECEWRFSTVLGHMIRLSFKILDIEPHVDCLYDNVLIFDGDNRNTSTLGRYCGSTFPEQIISSGTDMLLVFTTDNSVQRRGFEAEHDTVCGGTLTATFEPQTLVSHAGYGSKNYEAWEDCEWLFRAPEGMKVEIDFEFFNLEAQAECQYDFVAIYDGDSDNATSLGVHCGRSVSLRIVSSTNYLFLTFLTDNTINRKGFQLKFQSVSKAPKRNEQVD